MTTWQYVLRMARFNLWLFLLSGVLVGGVLSTAASLLSLFAQLPPGLLGLLLQRPAIVTVPAWLLLLGPRFTRLDTLDPATVASVLGKSFLLPMLLGIAVRGFLPDVSARYTNKGDWGHFSVAGLARQLQHETTTTDASGRM